MNRGQVADHHGACSCHPVRPGCCRRWTGLDDLTAESVDALDTAGFVWHVGDGCVAELDGPRSPRAGMRFRYIGDEIWVRLERDGPGIT